MSSQPPSKRSIRPHLSRRAALTGSCLGLLTAAGATLWGDPPSAATVSDPAVGATPEDRLLRPWGRLPTTARIGTGITVGPTGEIALLHRAGTAFAYDAVIDTDTVVVLNPRDGTVRRTWGAGRFRSPHSITADSEGRYWVTDVSTNKITTFDVAGRQVGDLGHDYPTELETCLRVRNVLSNLPCTLDEYIFARPTDVAVSADGSIVVTDGYRNSRVARFDTHRVLTRQWGELGDQPAQFNIPHGVALDSNGAVYVADRRNARVQVFNADGSVRHVWHSSALGRPYDVAIGPDDAVYVLDGGDLLDENNGEQRGYVCRLSTTGQVTHRWALADQRANPHQLAIGVRGEIYVAALAGAPLWRWAPSE